MAAENVVQSVEFQTEAINGKEDQRTEEEDEEDVERVEEEDG